MAIKVYLDEQLRARGITAKELCARVGITEANLSILRSEKPKVCGSTPSTASVTICNVMLAIF